MYWPDEVGIAPCPARWRNRDRQPFMAAVHESRRTNGTIAPLTAYCRLTWHRQPLPRPCFPTSALSKPATFLRLESKSAERRLISKRSGSAQDAPAKWAAQ